MAKEEEGVGQQAGQVAATKAFTEAKPPPKSSKKLLLFVIAPLLLLLIGGGGAYYFLGGKKDDEHAAAPPPLPPKPSVYYNLPNFLVNLNSRGGRSTFLKISVSLELEDAADVQRMQLVMPRIIDNIQAFLRELRIEDVRGTNNLARLRQELLARVNGAATPTKANDVLFLELLLQ
jgi:flagellar FliL protein